MKYAAKSTLGHKFANPQYAPSAPPISKTELWPRRIQMQELTLWVVQPWKGLGRFPTSYPSTAVRPGQHPKLHSAHCSRRHDRFLRRCACIIPYQFDSIVAIALQKGRLLHVPLRLTPSRWLLLGRRSPHCSCTKPRPHQTL